MIWPAWRFSVGGWRKSPGVFLAAAINVGVITRMGEEAPHQYLYRRRAGFVGVANYWYRARHRWSRDNGMITHTILHTARKVWFPAPTTIFINVTYWLEVLPPFPCPPLPVLAVLTMPIMAPLAILPTYSGFGRNRLPVGLRTELLPHLRRGHGRSGNRAGSYVRYLKWVAPLLILIIAEYGGTEHRSDDVTSQMAHASLSDRLIVNSAIRHAVTF